MAENARVVAERAGAEAVALYQRLTDSLPELRAALDAGIALRSEEESEAAAARLDAYLEAVQPLVDRLEGLTGRSFDVGRMGFVVIAA